MWRFLKKIFTSCCRRRAEANDDDEAAGEQIRLIAITNHPTTFAKCKNWCSDNAPQILKVTLNDAFNLANTVGFLAYSVYARAIRGCDPESKNPTDIACNKQIAIEAGYVGIALALLNFPLMPIVNSCLPRHIRNKITPTWEIIRDAIGRHAFLLQLILFTYTQIVRGLEERGGTPVKQSNTAFIVEAVAAAFFGFLGNATLREIIKTKLGGMFEKCFHRSSECGGDFARKLSNACLSAIDGFALGRGGVASLQARFTSTDSTGWQTARYSSGFVFYSLFGINGWRNDPILPLESKETYAKVLFHLTQILVVIFFGNALLENLQNKSNPHHIIQAIAYPTILAAMWAHSITKLYRNQPSQAEAHVEAAPDEQPPAPPPGSPSLLTSPSPPRRRNRGSKEIIDPTLSHGQSPESTTPIATPPNSPDSPTQETSSPPLGSARIAKQHIPVTNKLNSSASPTPPRKSSRIAKQTIAANDSMEDLFGLRQRGNGKNAQHRGATSSSPQSYPTILRPK